MLKATSGKCLFCGYRFTMLDEPRKQLHQLKYQNKVRSSQFIKDKESINSVLGCKYL